MREQFLDLHLVKRVLVKVSTLGFLGLVTSGCLTKSKKADLKIVNGSEDTAHWSFKHTVDIRTGFKELSGVIIADRWILTANHSFEDTKTATVHFGKDADDPEASIEGRVISHEEYFGGNKLTQTPHDIALIELEERIPAGFVPAPIMMESGKLTLVKKIGNQNVNQIGGKNLADLYDHYGLNDLTDAKGDLVLPMVVAGYGTTSEGALGTEGTFRWADVPLYGEEPAMNFILVGYPEALFPNIENRPEQKGTCDGDSGGPAFRYFGPGHYALVGVDFGRKASSDCGEVTMFTDVREYLPWIRSKIGDTPLMMVPGAEAAGDYLIAENDDWKSSSSTSSYKDSTGSLEDEGRIYNKVWTRQGDKIKYDFNSMDIKMCVIVEGYSREACEAPTWDIEMFERVIGPID